MYQTKNRDPKPWYELIREFYDMSHPYCLQAYIQFCIQAVS